MKTKQRALQLILGVMVCVISIISLPKQPESVLETNHVAIRMNNLPKASLFILINQLKTIINL